MAALAAATALAAFAPRRFPVLDSKILRDKYLRAEPQFTELFLLDTQIDMNIEATGLLKVKSDLLKGAIGLLLLSAVTLTSDVIFR